MVKKHRDSQKRIYFEDAVYFVTCKTEDGYPYFKQKIFCNLFVEQLRICKKLKGFNLYAWVLVHNHFHLLLKPTDKYNISKVMHFLKRHVSRNINIVTGDTNNRFAHPEGAVGPPRRRGSGIGKPKKNEFIEKIDNYILELKTQFNQNHSCQNPFTQTCLPEGRFQWQKSYHDHYIRNDNDFDYHIDYIIWNPVKHNIPDDWGYIFTNPNYMDLIDEFI